MKFKGQDFESTQVYLIDFKDEPDNEFPFEGSRGNFLLSLLGSYGLLDKIRMSNWAVQGEEIVIADIEQCNPKVIIAFGKEAVSQFLTTRQTITELSGFVTDIEIGKVKTKLLILPSPTYIMNQMENSNVVLKYSQDLYKAFEIINGEYVDILKEKEILTAHSFEEFKEIFETRFKDNKILSYDIETNARPPLTEGGKIIGFSLSNEHSGVYVSHDSLEFHMSKEDEDKIWNYFKKNIFDNPDRKVIIHNTMYERPYTLYCKNIEIGYEKAEDTLVMARLLKNPKEGAGLKYQAQKILHYPDWETNLTRYINMINYLVDRICLGPKKFNALAEEIITNKIGLDRLVITEAFTKLKDEDKKSFFDVIIPVLNVLKDLYTVEEYRNLCSLISEKVAIAYSQGGIIDSTIPYNWIPDKLLCQYGAVDAIATYDLYSYFIDFMNEESTDKVDLHKGYKNWLEHMYVAYIMERNGIHFEDSLATKDHKFLADQATNCLRSMLLSPCFKNQIIELCENNYKHIILADYLPEIASSQGYKVEYDKILNKFTVFQLNDKGTYKRVAMSRLNEIEIPEFYQKTYTALILTMFNEEVNDLNKDYEDLKQYYNPSSSTMGYIPREILVNLTLQMCGRISLLAELVNLPEFKDKINTLSSIEQKFLKLAQLICDEKQLKTTYNTEWIQYRKRLFDSFCTLYNENKKSVKIKEIKEILNNKEPIQIEHFDDNGIITVYNNLILTGIDINDKSTWSPEFEWMINFRLFKKSAKIITSYIDGNVGHQAVKVVNREDMENANHKLVRKRDYDPNIRSDEMYLMSSKWGPNTADTGRWRSALHTLPWNSPVKKYYTSRFKHGTTLCLDGDTEVFSLYSDKPFTLKELVEQDVKECWVLAYDETNNKLVPALAKNPRITRTVNLMYKITLSDGSVVRCTDNHKFYNKLSNEWVEAQELNVGDSLESYKISKNNSGYLKIGKEFCKLIEMKFIHRIVNESMTPLEDYTNMATHHIDHNIYNNTPENLRWMTTSEHSKLRTLGESLEEYEYNRKKFSKKASQTFKNWWATMPSEQYEFECQRRKDYALSDDSWNQSELSRKYASENITKYNKSKEHREIASKTMKNAWKTDEHRIKVLRGRIAHNINLIKLHTTVINEETYEKYKVKCSPKYSKIFEVFSSLEEAITYADSYNLMVVNIEKEQVNNEEVYCMTVDNYENFMLNNGLITHNCPDYSTMEVRTLAAISKDENMLELFHKGADFHTETAKKIFKKDEITSAERRFSKAATFSLLYGSSVSSFAKSYCNGDLEYANMIFDGFFEAYPNVKKWIEARHEEVQQDGRVSLELSNRFIGIPLEGSGVGAENARLRKAQNFPIQGQSADLTGGVIFDLQKWLEEEHLKSCVIMYVHDSIEVDVPPEELLKVIAKFKILLNESPMERMGLPSKADVALGKSLGHEIELKELETNEEMTEGWMILEGYKDEIDETIENWQGAYSLIEVTDEEYKDEFISMGELFIPKKAYSPTLGTMRQHGSCKVHIKY